MLEQNYLERPCTQTHKYLRIHTHIHTCTIVHTHTLCLCMYNYTYTNVKYTHMHTRTCTLYIHIQARACYCYNVCLYELNKELDEKIEKDFLVFVLPYIREYQGKCPGRNAS